MRNRTIGAPGSRYGASVVSASFRIRVLITCPFVLAILILTHTVIAYAQSPFPAAGAGVFFLLGGLVFAAVPILRRVWSSNSAWRATESGPASLERRLREAVRAEQVAGSSAWLGADACLKCGQTGPAAVLKAAARCKSCGRPVEDR